MCTIIQAVLGVRNITILAIASDLIKWTSPCPDTPLLQNNTVKLLHRQDSTV